MIEYLYLGRVDYPNALRLQSEIAAMVTAGRLGNVLLLLEHPPLLTLGRNASRVNILASDELLASRGVVIHEINRGGEVTYHGPGQLVGYPIFDLRTLHSASGGRMGPVDFVRGMEEALIRLCGESGIPAGRIAGYTGVWCGATSESAPQKPVCAATCSPPSGAVRKIAAIGIHVSRGITSHGFAFNLSTNLDDFTLINPCGIAGCPVTSLAAELASRRSASPPTLETLAHRTARQFGLVFNQQVLAVQDLAALRAHALKQQEFPAEDTPLQPPPEIERLHNPNPRPTRA